MKSTAKWHQQGFILILKDVATYLKIKNTHNFLYQSNPQSRNEYANYVFS